MKWNTPWSKHKRREIQRSLGRYLAMLVIVALGVGFFSGLKVTRSHGRGEKRKNRWCVIWLLGC